MDDQTRLQSISRRCKIWPVGDSYYYTARGNADGIDAELDPTPQVRIALRNILDRWGSDDGTLNLPSLMSKLNLDKIKDVNEALELIKLLTSSSSCVQRICVVTLGQAILDLSDK